VLETRAVQTSRRCDKTDFSSGANLSGYQGEKSLPAAQACLYFRPSRATLLGKSDTKKGWGWK